MNFDVILPTYNGEKYIKDSVNSILQQTYLNYHITIIDDASTDSTPAIIKKLQKKHPDKISIILLKTNKRAAGARMEAINKTTRELIAFIDQDDLWHKDKLLLQAKMFEKGADAVHSNIEFIDKNGKILHGKSNRENTNKRKIFKKPISIVQKYLCKKNYIRITSSAITRKAFNDVNGFNVSLFGGEDWLFWLKVVMQNKNIIHLTNKTTYKRVHQHNTSVIHKPKRIIGLLTACEKANDMYPEMKQCLKYRRYVVNKKYIASLIQLRKYQKAKKHYIELLKNKNLMIQHKLLLLFYFYFTKFSHALFRN